MRRFLTWAAAALIGFALLQAIFFGLLVAGASVPDGPIVRHLAGDVRSGDYGPGRMPDRMGGKADSYTECVVVGTGLGAPGLNPLRKAGEMPRIGGCVPGNEQIEALDDGESVGTAPYFRYWAGYTVITRPVLALTDMTGLRLICGALLLAGFALALREVGRATSGIAAIGLLAPLALASNVLTMPSTGLSQALSVATLLLGTAACARAARRSLTAGLVAVVVSAAVFCFMDLLTTPAMGWALCAAVVTAATFVRTGRLTTSLVAVLASGFLWPLSFALTWVSRWAIAVPFEGWDRVTSEVKEMILFRTGGDMTGVRDALGAASEKNLHYWLDTVATAHGVLYAAALVTVFALGWAIPRGRSYAVAPALIGFAALTVPFWYEALRNHSQVHAFFVYRNVPVAVGVLCFAALVAATAKIRHTEPEPVHEAEADLGNA